MKVLNSIIGTLVVVSATAFSAPSQAATTYRFELSHGSVACIGTTPSYNNMLLTRNDGRWNSTVNPSFVQCGGVATPMTNSGDVVVYEVGLSNLANPGAAAVTINCSLVDGIGAVGGTPTAVYPKSVTIRPGQVAYLDWDGTDTGGTSWADGARFVYPAVSCTLPPKAELSYSAIIYQEEIGG